MGHGWMLSVIDLLSFACMDVDGCILRGKEGRGRKGQRILTGTYAYEE